MYLNHVGGTCAACGSTGSNDDQVASFCQTVLQQVLIHEMEQTFLIGDHLNLLSVNAPQHGQEGTNLRAGGERDNRGLGTQTCQTTCGVTGLGESNDELCIQLVGDVHCCAGNCATAGAGLAVQLGHAVQAALFGILNDCSHSLQGQDRVLTDRGLTGEHHCVCAVEDCVSAVRNLCTGGDGVVGHGLEHLGCHDDGLCPAACHVDCLLLDEGNLGEGQLNTEVTTSDHDAVELVDDVLQVLNCLGLLNLGNDGYADTLFVHDLVDGVNVCAGTDEGECNDVCTHLQCEAQVVRVLLGQRGQGDCCAGQVDALVVGDGTTDDHAGANAGGGYLNSFEADLTVVEQELVAELYVAGQTLVGGATDFCGTFNVFGSDGEVCAGLKVFLAVCETLEANLGALQVGEDSNVLTELCRLVTDGVVACLVLGVVTVAHVQTGDVQASLDCLGDLLGGLDCRTDGCNDFCAPHVPNLCVLFHVAPEGSH